MVTKTFKNKKSTSPMANYVKRATPIAQEMWSMLSPQEKKQLLKEYGDSDKDKTANGADCHPFDPRRQDDWLPDQKSLATKISTVKPGKLIGRGCVGEVHKVQGKGMDGFVVKVPRINGRQYSARKLSTSSIKEAQEELKKELDTYKKYKLNDLPLFIPTKEIKVDDPNHKGHIAALRPAVEPITEYYPDLHFKKKPNDKQLQQLYRDMMILSGEGFCFVDGLQLGIDKSGRVQIYDVGFIEKEPKGTERAYRVNDYQWQEILEALGKQNKFPALEKPIKRPAVGKRRPMKTKKSIKI